MTARKDELRAELDDARGALEAFEARERELAQELANVQAGRKHAEGLVEEALRRWTGIAIDEAWS